MVPRESMNVPQVSDTSVENSLKVDLECEDNKNLNLSDTDSDILGKYNFKYKKSCLFYYIFDRSRIFISFLIKSYFYLLTLLLPITIF